MTTPTVDPNPEKRVHFIDYKKEYPTQYSTQYERSSTYDNSSFLSSLFNRSNAPSDAQQDALVRQISNPKHNLLSPRDQNFFVNAVNASLAAILGSVLTYPFIKARTMMSISPNLSSQERMQRYVVALPQLIAEKGVRSLLSGYETYAVMVPAITLDLAFFYAFKDLLYPRKYFREIDLPWFANAFMAGAAAACRYALYQPFADAYLRVTSYTSTLKGGDLVREIQGSMQSRVKAKGLKGLYEGFAKNLPGIVVFRAVQLGTLETAFQRLKYERGHTSIFQKFIICYGVTVISKYIAYPFDLARQLVVDGEGGSNQVMKNYFDSLKAAVKREGTVELFRKATVKAFQASGSTLALCIFYHLNDDGKKLGQVV